MCYTRGMETLPQYHERTAEIHALLGGECVECGSEEDLQVDHLLGDGREFRDLSGATGHHRDIYRDLMTGNNTYEVQLLCHSCHDEKTRDQSGWSDVALANKAVRQKEADRRRSAEYRAKNKEKIREQQAEWRSQNKDHISEYMSNRYHNAGVLP